MSICIAAIAHDCVDGDHIVVVTDHLITTGNFSSTEVVDPKVFTATTDGRWLGMGAGNLSAIQSIRRAYARAWVGKAQDLEEVVPGYQRAYKKEFTKKIEDEILSRYGFTHERFFKEGHATLGDKQFRRTMNQINNVALDAELLLAGFDADDRPHVVSITTPGTRVIHDALGYHAIGSGATLARACLTATYHGAGEKSEVIYRLAEAKFRSEEAPYVGDKKTTIVTLSSKGKMQLVTDADKIREVWAATANPPPPQLAMDLIPGLLTTIREPPKRAGNSAGEDDSDEGIEEDGTGADEYDE